MAESLESLLHPHDPAQLLAAMRDNRRLCLRGATAFASPDLLSWETINGLITVEHLQRDRVRLVRRNMDIPIDLVTSKPRGPTHAKGREINTQALQQLCDQGLSIFIRHIEELVPRIGAMNAMIERLLRATIYSYCYVSFTRESAFKPHWDDHNVFVLQLHGSKRWTFFGQPEPFPVRDGGKIFDREALGDPEAETVLEPGDVLYLPRGEIHCAEVVDESSVHLTLGHRPPLVPELVDWLVSEAMQEQQVLRRDLLPQAEPDQLQAQIAAIREALGQMVDGLGPQDLDRFFAHLDTTRPPVTPLNLGLRMALRPDTRVMSALRRNVANLPAANALPTNERAALSELLRLQSATVEELHEALPDLSWDQIARAVTGLAGKSLVFLFA